VVDASTMFGSPPLQIVAVFGLTTVGIGFTVTVIVNGAPGQLPVVDVGVTRYCTLPTAPPLGLTSVWLIVVPVPGEAPVIPPVIAPIVHANEDGVPDVSAMFGLVLLQIAVVAELVTAGVGFTVTVIVNGAPAQLPVTEVGVTIYSTVPAVVLLGLVSV
jgi:hypothetical protein